MKKEGPSEALRAVGRGRGGASRSGVLSDYLEFVFLFVVIER